MNEKREAIELCVSYRKETRSLALEPQQSGDDIRRYRESCQRWRRGALEEAADRDYSIPTIREF